MTDMSTTDAVGAWRKLVKECESIASNGHTPARVKQCFQGVVSYMEAHLGAVGGDVFAHIWLMGIIAEGFLRETHEDDHVRFDGNHTASISALSDLIGHDWLPDSLRDLGNAYRAIAERRVTGQRKVEFHDEEMNLTAEFSLAPGNIPPFNVSSLEPRVLTLLERSLAHPAYAASVEEAFFRKIREVRGITALCFVEKSIGPVGAVGMLSSLVRKTELPATIYREGYWQEDAKLVGTETKKDDRLCVVYDLCVTGRAIRNIAAFLEGKERGRVTDAVVLFSYDSTERPGAEILRQAKIRLWPIISEQEVAAELAALVEGQTESTVHFKPITGRRALRPSAMGERPPKGGQVPMVGKADAAKPGRGASESSWWGDRRMVSLQFRSKREFSKATKIVCEKERGIPYNIVGFEVMRVPASAVRCFAGLKYRVVEGK